MSAREKLASKTIIDVGAARVGEAAGGVLLQGMLVAGMAGMQAGILLVGCALSAMAGASLPGQWFAGMPANGERTRADRTGPGRAPGLGTPQPIPDIPTPRGIRKLAGLPTDDHCLKQAAILRSGDAEKVRALLARGKAREPLLAPFLVRLLAWDEVSDAVVDMLRAAPFPLEGQLTDALLHRGEDFAIRRRVPRILSARPCQLSAEARLQGLRDRRLPVRFRCGKALAKITRIDGGLIIEHDHILRAVECECFVSKTVWNRYCPRDRRDETEESLYFVEVLKDRTSKGLELEFTLLSLVLPREAPRIAFKGLHTTDPYLRGTALEYPESVLPENIRERLWALLESDARTQKQEGRPRSRDEILADLRRSNQSIIVNLERLRGHAGSSADPGKPAQGQTGGSGLEAPVKPDKRKEP